jgi:hypothetical protein
MKLYCYVENNTVISGPQLLPVNLESLSDFELLEKGWMVAERIIPTSIDHFTELWNIEFEIQQYKVIARFNKQSKTPEQIQEHNLEMLHVLREMRDNLLTTFNNVIGNSEWNELSPEKKAEWYEYKATLENLILTDDIDSRTIMIPISPQ